MNQLIKSICCANDEIKDYFDGFDDFAESILPPVHPKISLEQHLLIDRIFKRGRIKALSILNMWNEIKRVDTSPLRHS